MDTVAITSDIYSIAHVALDASGVSEDDALALSRITARCADILNSHGVSPADVLRARGII